MSDLKEWVAEATGGTVRSWDALAGGASRKTWAVDVERDGRTLPLVVRADTGRGPFSGTPFTLARESAIYRALAGTGVPVPRLHAQLADVDALLLDRLPGSDDLSTVGGPEELRSVVDSFMDALAGLHCVDVAGLDLPGYVRPTTGPQHATADLDAWERIAGGLEGNDPFVRFTLGWLRRCAPGDVQRTVLVWGDAGPGNFLHHEGAVSALLDWELAHVGDPMDDIAFLYTRVHLLQQPFGDMAANLRRYAAGAGLDVDAAAVFYYRVFVALRMILSCRLALAAGARAAVYHVLPPVLERAAIRTMAELDGVELEPAAPLEPTPPTASAAVLDTLMYQFTNDVMPAVGDAILPREQLAFVALIAHVQTAERLGAAAARAELADAARLLGARPRSLAEAQVALHDRAVSHAGDDFLAYLSRRSDRTIALWEPAIGPMATMPFPEVVVA